MKQEKGITLISLTIYIITMAIVIAVLAIITTFFYKNMSDAGKDMDPITEYTTFNSYFSEEINHNNIKVLECSSNNGQNYIVFSNQVQYTYVPENKAIYRNQVKICRNIDNCAFLETIEDGRSVIQVTFKAGNQDRITKYTIQN